MSKRSAALSVAILCLIAAALPARAGENRRDDVESTAQIGIPPKPTSRTLLQVVSQAVTEGADLNIDPDIASNLGLRPDYRLRVLRYRAQVTPDKLEHEFQVVYKRGKGGTVEPVAVLFDIAEVSLENAMKNVRGTTLLVDLEGALQKAAGREAAYKKVFHAVVPKDRVADLYKGELQFYEQASIGLPFEK